MTSSSRRHSLEDLLALKWLLGAVMGLVCVTTLFNVSGHGHMPAMVCCVVISFALLRPGLFARVPPWAWKGYAIAIIPLVMVNVVQKDTIPALLDLNTWLILYRCLNHTRRREEMQLALLCLFLIIMAGILTATLAFGLQLLIFSAIAVSYLVVNTVIETKAGGDYGLIEKMQRDKAPDIGRAASAVLGLRLFVLGVALFGSLLFVATVVFVGIPRVSIEDKISLFSLKPKETLSGFSDMVKLGEVTDIKNDDTVALRVDVPDEAAILLMPYWRMLALDEYEEGSFRLSNDLIELQKSSLSSPYHSIRYWPERRFAQAPSDVYQDRWRFFLEPEVSRYLPLPGTFRHMTVANLSDLSIGPHAHSVATKELGSRLVSYELEGVDLKSTVPDVRPNAHPRFLSGGAALGRNSDGALRYPETLLALPQEEAAAKVFRDAALEIMAGQELPPLDFARRLNTYLWRKHGYSMQVSLSTNGALEDPVARWFSSSLPGHCEFFASSFVLTARAAGFPSRVVVGFKGGEWNSYENYFMVRNSDAHAWAEIYDGAGNWIRVDPTPGSETPSVRPPTELVRDRVGESDSMAFLDSLRLLWYRRIVNFDEAAQREAAVRLKDFFLAYMGVAKTWAIGFGKYMVAWFTAPWSLWRFIYLMFLLFLLLGAFMVQRNMTLNVRELLLAPFRVGDPVRRKAGKCLQKLANRGAQDNEASERVVQDLQRLRFGSKETWPNARLVFQRARRLR